MPGRKIFKEEKMQERKIRKEIKEKEKEDYMDQVFYELSIAPKRCEIPLKLIGVTSNI